MHLEQYEPQASWRSSIWMFVAGTAIGAVAALIMAPTSGRESREYLRKQGRRMASDVGAQADKLASAVKWGQEQATSAVRGTVDSARAAYDAATSTRSGESQSVTAGMSSSSSQGPGVRQPASPRPVTSSQS
jgi:gas vesicle protein